MNGHFDPFQQACVLQCLAAANHGMAKNGIMFSQKSMFQGLAHCLPFRKPQGTKPTICKECLVVDTKLQPEGRK